MNRRHPVAILLLSALALGSAAGVLAVDAAVDADMRLTILEVAGVTVPPALQDQALVVLDGACSARRTSTDAQTWAAATATANPWLSELDAAKIWMAAHDRNC